MVPFTPRKMAFMPTHEIAGRNDCGSGFTREKGSPEKKGVWAEAIEGKPAPTRIAGGGKNQA